MAIQRSGRMHVVAEARAQPLLPSGVLGMLIFVFAELMLFGGMISAFTIIKSGAAVWPPPGQPRLPFERTAFNTLFLLASGAMLMLARRSFQRDRAKARMPMAIAMGLGAAFVGLQGIEWMALLRQGLTLTSSSLGSFFYLIIGLHALHAVVALGVLGHAWQRLQRGWLASSQLATAEVLWYFVVLVWPLLYLVVYP